MNSRKTTVEYHGRTRTIEDRWDGKYALRILPREWTGNAVFLLRRPAPVPGESGDGPKAVPGPTGGGRAIDPPLELFIHCCCEPRSTLSRLFGRTHAVTDVTMHEDFTDA
eukprot:8725520-Alexandrium_andersonii.AAC.1